MNLLVLNYEYPPLGGGAGEITRNISENIALLGHKVTVVTTWFEGLAEDEVKNNVHIIRLRSKRKTLHASNVFEMRSWIKESKRFLSVHCKNEKYDCCFANFSIPGGVTAYFLKKRFGIPYTIISHGHDIPWLFKKEMFFYHVLTFFAIKRICRASSYNFIQTPAMKKNIDAFLSQLHPEKNVMIPNGIDPLMFSPDISKRTEKIRILFSGRLVQQKDPFTFLKALKILFGSGVKNVEVLISGDGPLKNKMQQFVRENELTDTVKFSGWITRDELIIKYQEANIFVQTSRYEAMSMAVMEALACGAYVICTRVGSNETVFREGYNGSFFDIGNEKMLAEKLSLALKDAQKDKQKTVSSDTIMEWKAVAEKYIYYFSHTHNSKS